MIYLELKNISYSIKDIDILKEINLKVKKGECISIVGSSGSGKSTLLKLCAYLINETKGKIKFKEKKYDFYSPMELRKEISYCIQTPCLFGKSVRENLEFPFKIRKEKINEKRIDELLEIFNLEKEILDKKVHLLSGGESQRIALIRNLIYIPKILLLDEVTSALDEVNVQIVERYIKELNKKNKVTVLWNTHDRAQSERMFNRRIVMDKGQIVAIEEKKVYE